MAVGSTFETVACFFVARKQSYVSQHDLEEMKKDGESLSKRINAFKRTLK
jgi:four helix bundle protein